MAFMHPKIEDTASIRPFSEQDVYVALRDQLSSEYRVFHSYPWLRRWRGDKDKALMEGEADFVILHPRRGLMVLEVKGGDVRTQGQDWYRVTERGTQEVKDPFRQAQRNMRALLSIIEDWLRENRAFIRLKGRSAELTFGFAVFFPDINYKGSLPAHADRAIVLCHRDLRDVESAIERAYSAWEDHPRPLSDQNFSLLYQSLTARPVFVRPIGATIAAAEERLLLLTESQSYAYRALLRGKPRMLIQGPAGSGKTELALARAVELAVDGRRVLFTCFNRELASWLRERVAREPLLAGAVGSLDVFSFHDLSARLAKETGLEWAPEDTATFWNDEIPEILATAIRRLEERGAPARYDAIILDEGQDFYSMWWWVLVEDLLAEDDDALLYAFLDPNQSLRAEASVPRDIGLEGPIMILENCRNTRKIADLSARTIQGEFGLHRLAPEGSLPRVIWAKSVVRQRALVEEELRRLLTLHSIQPEQLALVGVSKNRGSLEGITELLGVPLTRSAVAWREGGSILVTTARSFKGLEADVVILYDIGGLSRYFTREDLYVACSRARFHLSVIVHKTRDLYAELAQIARTAG